MSPQPHQRSGFTLFEVVLAFSLMVILIGKIAVTIQSASRLTDEAVMTVRLSDQAQRTMDRIAYAVMGSELGTLFPLMSAPASSARLDYRVSLGVESGKVVWADPERIGLDGTTTRLVWSENPGAVGERQVLWTNLMRPFLEGEVPNGIDDNGNGLIDEKGLSFVSSECRVTIRITLGRETKGDRVIEETLESTVTCRNLGEPAG